MFWNFGDVVILAKSLKRSRVFVNRVENELLQKKKASKAEAFPFVTFLFLLLLCEGSLLNQIYSSN
jgi:hypothetical protein